MNGRQRLVDQITFTNYNSNSQAVILSNSGYLGVVAVTNHAWAPFAKPILAAPAVEIVVAVPRRV